MAEIINLYGYVINSKKFKKILNKEQKLYLRDMAPLPPGIAENSALLENVFVTLVCILNKIPVFIVGKPGLRPLFYMMWNTNWL
jgi:E3 ubiquitin-protein ligase RNF213